MIHRPPKNDRERLQNLIAALAEPGDDDDALDEELRADLARRGLTLETWAARFQARAQAVIDRETRARRVRTLKIAAAGAAGLSVAAGVGLLMGEAASVIAKDPVPVQQALTAGAEGSAAPAADAGPRRGPARR